MSARSKFRPLGEIKAKVAKARTAKTAWKELRLDARIKLLEPIRDEFRQRTDEIAELITRETGKSISESVAEVSRYTDGELTWFLENASKALADETTLKDDESFPASCTNRMVWQRRLRPGIFRSAWRCGEFSRT